MTRKNSSPFADMFTPEVLKRLLPAGRSNDFFDALYGDPSEGAYDIALDFRGSDPDRLYFALELRQRPGKCLVCSLTYGLPEVLKRHPVIDLNGVVQELCAHMENGIQCQDWTLGPTREVSPDLHEIPLRIQIRTA
ncbi:MAG: pancreas/duodenum homeobox protein 1 [Deltaproteobacteria bacterium]|nr:pancreas/duodenum homeobox protein 1 [Deltaproteobacteria bacterium]